MGNQITPSTRRCAPPPTLPSIRSPSSYRSAASACSGMKALQVGPPTLLQLAQVPPRRLPPSDLVLELVEILRKLVLTGFFAGVWTGTVLQLFAALIFAILFALQLMQPYRLASNNFIGIIMAAGLASRSGDARP